MFSLCGNQQSFNDIYYIYNTIVCKFLKNTHTHTSLFHEGRSCRLCCSVHREFEEWVAVSIIMVYINIHICNTHT
jgi:hypothetical protein